MKQPQNVFIKTELLYSRDFNKSLPELLKICPALWSPPVIIISNLDQALLQVGGWGEGGALFTDVCTDWEAAA